MQQTAVDWLVNRVYMVIPDSERNFLEGLRKEGLEKEKEQMLDFYMWMRMNDSAEAYFHYSDDDMFAEYLNQNK
jgi:hypothetical protein